MCAAHNNWDTSLAILSRNLVGATSGVDFDTDGDQVRRLVVRNLLHAIVVQHAFDVGRREAGQDAQTERLHPCFVHVQAVILAADIRHDEGDFHAVTTSITERFVLSLHVKDWLQVDWRT